MVEAVARNSVRKESWLARRAPKFPRHAVRHSILDALLLLFASTDTYCRKSLAIAAVLVITASVATALAPVALKCLIDAYSLGGADLYPRAALLGVAYALFLWFARCCDELRLAAYSRGEQRFVQRLSRYAFNHVVSLPLAFHFERRTGAVNQTLINALIGYRSILSHATFTIVPVLVQVLIMTVVLIQVSHPGILVVLSVAIVAYGIIFAIGVARTATPARDVASQSAEASAQMVDSLLNLETIKCFGAEAQVERRYEEVLSKTESRWEELRKRRAANGLLIATVFGLSLLATIGFGSRAVANGSMTVGDLVLVNTYLLQIVKPLEMIGYASRDITQGLAFIHELKVILRRAAEPPGSTNWGVSKALVSVDVKQIHFGYSSGRRILRGLTFCIPAGTKVGVVGPSGCGKSTVVRLLLKLVQPSSGQILIGERSIDEWSAAALRRTVAVVPQDTVLLNDTIASNIALGALDRRKGEIERAASLASLHEFVSSLPNGYDTIVGERGLKISAGERQRIAIARAVFRRPCIYIFDEATSLLDSQTELAVLQNMKRISEGVTTLVIAHRLINVVDSDEIFVMNKGVMVERGSHYALLQQNGLYASMWRRQQLEHFDSTATRVEASIGT